jgi:hypothetical protein
VRGRGEEVVVAEGHEELRRGDAHGLGNQGWEDVDDERARKPRA